MYDSFFVYHTKNKTLLLFLLLTSCLLAGCSDNPVAYKDKDIAVKITGEGLEVLNKMDRPIYYFGVDQETAAVIFWVPRSTAENEIKPLRKETIPFSDIAGYKEGSTVIFNFWTSQEPEEQVDVRNIVIETTR